MSERNVSSNGVETYPRFDRALRFRTMPPPATDGQLHLGWLTLSTPTRGLLQAREPNGLQWKAQPRPEWFG